MSSSSRCAAVTLLPVYKCVYHSSQHVSSSSYDTCMLLTHTLLPVYKCVHWLFSDKAPAAHTHIHTYTHTHIHTYTHTHIHTNAQARTYDIHTWIHLCVCVWLSIHEYSLCCCATDEFFCMLFFLKLFFKKPCNFFNFFLKKLCNLPRTLPYKVKVVCFLYIPADRSFSWCGLSPPASFRVSDPTPHPPHAHTRTHARTHTHTHTHTQSACERCAGCV